MNIEISKNTYSKLFLGWFVADAGSFINKTILCRVDSVQNSYCCGCFSCITYHYYPSHFLFPSFVSSKGCCCNHIFLRTAQVIIRHLSDAMFNNKNNFPFSVVHYLFKKYIFFLYQVHWNMTQINIHCKFFVYSMQIM